ncbi:HD family phosphohydrolase [Natranaerobius trueperi]|uniref:Metal-dependent phosphohydrolase n=1 Tax=Natranaerobius trueperi TaxID=759412 RepID=A0A226BW99_9FIRM|nr:HDIG domain-containing metalloprotein [Natranaerobius trueperi]OWZ83062.1 metal-dependent phosphohydrolase [Natranaerobius trueperi]
MNLGRGAQNENNSSTNNKEIKPLCQRVFIAFIVFLSVFAVTSVGFLPDTLEVGQVSPKTFYAPEEVVDRYTTEERRSEAEKDVPEVYDLDPSIKENSLKILTETFDLLIEANVEYYEKQEEALEQNEEYWNESETVTELEDDFFENAPVSLAEDMSIPIGDFSIESLEEVKSDANTILSNLLDQGIKPDAIDNAKEQIEQQVDVLPYHIDLKEFSLAALQETVSPNMTYNEDATEERRMLARKEVEPETIVEGEVIVREGERITERHLMILEDLGLQRAHGDYFMLLGLAILIAIVIGLAAIYIYYYFETTFYDNTLLVLLGLIFVATLVIARVSSVFSGYLIPTAMAAILFTVLFGARLSIVLVSLLAILIGVMSGNNIDVAILAIVGGFTGTYSVAKLQQRGDLTRAGLYVGLINATTIFALFLVDGGFRIEYDILADLLVNVFYGISNGILSAILAIGFLPYLDSAFGLTTSIRLLELANPNHPLLKKLLVDAPGTYHHSIIVANLAETAADELDADPILARVGAYYHDIGKITRPYFFIENQLTKDNPHDKISPSLSSLIITSHIKDGVELAKKNKLPRVIIDIIKEHHGTKMVSYFYQKACKDNSREDNLIEEDFRYTGPRPQSKESAIIMLADSVEAAVRTISSPNPGKIEGLVRKLIKQHLTEGHLDECHLTLKDLNIIAESFSKILSGIFHSRIEYPENLPDKREGKHGTDSKQPNGHTDNKSTDEATEKNSENDS